MRCQLRARYAPAEEIDVRKVLKIGAGERVRTVDLNLGKVALYQLSYAR